MYIYIVFVLFLFFTYTGSGDLGRGQIGGHPERWESQPGMETLDRRWQTLSGEHSVIIWIIITWLRLKSTFIFKNIIFIYLYLIKKINDKSIPAN